jgi:hypothetical protein
MTHKVYQLRIKKLFLGFAFMFSIAVASAFPKDTLNRTNYKNFVHMTELWVCTSNVFPIDLSLNAFGIGYNSLTGHYVQIKTPGSYTDGNINPVPGTTVSGVFNPTGRPAGIYEFVYVSDVANFCGMGLGEKSIVRLYLVPELVGSAILSNICAGEAFDVKLADYLPYEIKNFVDSAGWQVQFYDSKTNAPLSVSAASLANLGLHNYYYKIDDSGVGSFSGKYMFGIRQIPQSSPAYFKHEPLYACADSGHLTHTVKIRDSIMLVQDTVKVTFCTQSLMSVPESRDRFVVNLSNILGINGKDGSWTTNHSQPLQVILSTDGYAKINMTYVSVGMTEFFFYYNFKNCGGSNDTATVHVNFTDDLSSVIVSDTGTICRNLGTGTLDLGLFFGFSVPNTAGVWMDIYKKNTVGIDYEILSGSIDLSELKVGSLYEYQYRVHPSSLDLCQTGVGYNDILADYYLKVRDVEVLSGSAQICRSLFNSGTYINLYDYVPGLGNPNLVDPSEVTWTAPDGTHIPAADVTNYRLQGTANKNKDTILNFSFVYANDCGRAPGNLYIGFLDSIPHGTNRVLQLCYTDDYAKYVNLFQVLGYAGLKGTFELESTVPAGKSIEWIDQAKGIFNAADTFDPANAEEEYTFIYKRDPSEANCAPDNLRITVIVTRNLEQEQP